MLFKLILLIIAIQKTISFDYGEQAKWIGLCKTGKKQSPINIPCDDFIEKCPP